MNRERNGPECATEGLHTLLDNRSANAPYSWRQTEKEMKVIGLLDTVVFASVTRRPRLNSAIP